MEEKKTKILIVDDEPDVVATLQNFLALKGYNVDCALDGEEALEILKKQKTDLVLLDIVLPGIKGDEVARIIKEKYPESKIIVVTGYPSEGEILLKENVLDALFMKPLRMQELYSKLLETLHQQPKEPPRVEEPQKLKARILFIKAKILFIEPAEDIYHFLESQFKQLSKKGENYEIDAAFSEPDIMRKITFFNPDIVIFDKSFFDNIDSKYFTEKILQLPNRPKEIVIYNLSSSTMEFSELERLTTTVRALCLKNGLIEVRWVEL